MKSSLKRIAVLAKRNFKEIIRDPIMLIFMFALPIGMEVLFYLLFHAATTQFEMRFLAPGMLVFGQAFLTLFLAMLISIDRASSFVIRLYTTELKPYEFIASYALAIIPIALIQGAALLSVASVIEPAFFSAKLLAALAAGLLPATLFISLGILFGSLFGEKSVGGVASIIITCHSLLSGMWYPTEGINATVLKIMDILPFKNANSIIQSIAGGYVSAENTLFPCLIVASYAAVIFTVSVLVYRRKMIQ